jgi:phage host-nuclease inhibitor protein Gam
MNADQTALLREIRDLLREQTALAQEMRDMNLGPSNGYRPALSKVSN